MQNVLTGDAKAGEAYFNGAGGCKTCHSPTGDLAGIANRFDPPALQQRFLFPRGGGGRRGGGGGQSSNPVIVTLMPTSDTRISGVLVHLDDFTVAWHDSGGRYGVRVRHAGEVGFRVSRWTRVKRDTRPT